MRTFRGDAGSTIALALAVVASLACASALGQEQGTSGRTMIEARLPDQPARPAASAAAPEQPAARSAARGGPQVTLITTESNLPAEERLRAMTSRSTEGLKTVRRADGAVGIDLEGRFMHVIVAKRAEDGSLVLSCHDGDEALEHVHEAEAIAAGRAPRVKPLARVVVSPPRVTESVPPAQLEEK